LSLLYTHQPYSRSLDQLEGNVNPTTPPPDRAAHPAPTGPRLLDQLRQAARQHGHPEPAVAAFADWAGCFIRFHGLRHPRELGLPEIGAFLDSVAQADSDPLRAITACRDALDFLYRTVLLLDLGEVPLP
jgi:hypothetical protein